MPPCVWQPRSTISLRGPATFTGITGALLEESTTGVTLGTTDASASKEWTIVDAGSVGATPLVFLRSASGLNLEDWRGVLGLSTDTGDAQKWQLTDASQTGGTAGSGKVFVQSLRGDCLEDRYGAVGIAPDCGSYQMWTLVPAASAQNASSLPTSSSSSIITSSAESSSALLPMALLPAVGLRRAAGLRRSLLFKATAPRQPTELMAPIDETVTIGRPAKLVGGEEVAFQLSNVGILTCHSGYAPVDASKSECETAAAYLGKTFSSTVYYDWERARPAGCFYHDSSDYLGDTIYFNPYQGGDRYGDDMRVCRLSPPPPPPMPPSPPLPPSPPASPPMRGTQMCLSDLHADGVSSRADGNTVAGLSVWVWGSKTYPMPAGDLAGQTTATTTSPPAWSGSSICVYFSPVMDQCFEIRDTADNMILNSVCIRMMPQELPSGAVLYKTYKRLELSGGASLAFFFSPA